MRLFTRAYSAPSFPLARVPFRLDAYPALACAFLASFKVLLESCTGGLQNSQEVASPLSCSLLVRLSVLHIYAITNTAPPVAQAETPAPGSKTSSSQTKTTAVSADRLAQAHTAACTIACQVCSPVL